MNYKYTTSTSIVVDNEFNRRQGLRINTIKAAFRWYDMKRSIIIKVKVKVEADNHHENYSTIYHYDEIAQSVTTRITTATSSNGSELKLESEESVDRNLIFAAQEEEEDVNNSSTTVY